MKIWIDADSAPKKARLLVFQASTRYSLETVLVANWRFRLPTIHPFLRQIIVPVKADAADKQILRLARPGDLAITSDVVLAYRLMIRHVNVIHPRGTLFNSDWFRRRLDIYLERVELRDFTYKGSLTPIDLLRIHGRYGDKHSTAFAETLESTIARCLVAPG
jgi:uncharacterized protein